MSKIPPPLSLQEVLIQFRGDLETHDDMVLSDMMGKAFDIHSLRLPARTFLMEKSDHKYLSHPISDQEKLMPAKGGDINKKNLYGNTVLHAVFEYCGYNSMLLLTDTFLRFGADPQIRNDHGDTPLMSGVLMCIEMDDDTSQSLLYLLNNGANPLTPNNEGNTPAGLILKDVKKNKYAHFSPDLVNHIKSFTDKLAITSSLNTSLNMDEPNITNKEQSLPKSKF